MRLRKLLLFVFFSYSTLTYGQQNMTLLSSIDFSEGVSDVWGYVAPDGTEYALLGLHDGVTIISLIDPSQPEVIHKVNGEFNIWRDIKVYEDFAYVITEGENGGLTVIDLQPT